MLTWSLLATAQYSCDGDLLKALKGARKLCEQTIDGTTTVLAVFTAASARSSSFIEVVVICTLLS
jgi:hypothetical protein